MDKYKFLFSSTSSITGRAGNAGNALGTGCSQTYFKERVTSSTAVNGSSCTGSGPATGLRALQISRQ